MPSPVRSLAVHRQTGTLKNCLAFNYSFVIMAASFMKTFFFSGVGRLRLILLVGCVALVLFAANHSALAQATTQQRVVVTAPGAPGAYEEVPSAYGAPPEFSRSRFSNAVNAYVLPPWAFFFGELFEGQGFRHGPPN